jgi:ribosome-associated protein
MQKRTDRLMIRIADGVDFDDNELSERFIRSSGPGGQNVNKVATAVELRLDLSRSSLPEPVKARLRSLAGKRLNTDDVLLIDSRAHRTQMQNREDARRRLLALLRRAAVRPKVRRPTRPGAAAREQRLTDKKQRSRLKTTRRRHDDE